jgi:cation:H+ antiporter
MVALKIFLLIIICFILASATKLLILSFERLAKLWGMDDFFLTNLLIAFGTSAPELVIGINAALKGNPTLGLGNILGSNIANISLIIGGATLITGNLIVPQKIAKNDIYYTFLVAAAPLILLADGNLSRLEALLLIVLYLIWQGISFKSLPLATEGIIKKTKKLFFDNFNFKKEFLKCIGSLIVVLVASRTIVAASTSISQQFLIPTMVIGVFILGIGSALPELTFDITGLDTKKHQPVLGNLLGSLAVNSSLIVGIICLIQPIKLFDPGRYFRITIYFLAIFFLFYLFIKSKRKLEKWEGAFLVAAYIILVILEIP